MDKELKDKIDVGFKVEAESAENVNKRGIQALWDFFDEAEKRVTTRLESLKLAYEVAFKQDVFNPIHWNKMTEEKQIEAYQQIFELADYNCNYLVSGKSGL